MSKSRLGVNSECFGSGQNFSRSGLVPRHKVKLFLKMFNFMSLYVGSDNKVIIDLDLKDKFVKYRMKNGQLNKATAQKILDGYNVIKLATKE